MGPNTDPHSCSVLTAHLTNGRFRQALLHMHWLAQCFHFPFENTCYNLQDFCSSSDTENVHPVRQIVNGDLVHVSS